MALNGGMKAPVIVFLLHLTAERLARARTDLIDLDLIAYDPPLYQVLSWPEPAPVATRFARLHAILGGRS